MSPWTHRGAWALVVLLTAARVRAQDTPLLDVAAQNALLGQHCATCHSTARASGGLVLQGFDVGSPLLSGQRLELLIRALRLGQMPPAGAQPLPAGDRAGLVAAFEARADAMAARRPDPGWRPLARLNRAEYTRVVKDLVDVDVDAAAVLPPDASSGGFDTIADVQTSSPALVSAYVRGAAQVSRQAMAVAASSPARWRRLFPCRPARPADEPVCAAAIVNALTARAYRGLATPADVADALAFYARGRARGSFSDGIRLALQAILSAPKFLFRLEPVDEHGALSDVALASRLSFFLWSRGPDDVLLDAARRGALHTPEQLAAQARRILADPRAETLATRFAAQWLRLQDLGKSAPDPARFPAFDAALARDMRRETELVVADLVRRDGDVTTLLTGDRSFVNARLARLYGIRGVTGDAFRPVTMPPSRRGLLGHASVLTLTSVGTRTSPVLRGKWVLDVLLGAPPSPPPPNVPDLDVSAAESTDGAPRTTRARIEAHRASPACAGCHRVIDPPGLALEHFDAIGAWRDTDNGVAVDAAAEFYDGQPLNGEAGLRTALVARQDVFLHHFTEQLMTYAIGRRLTYRDQPAVRAVTRRAAANGQRVSAFVTGVVTSDAFRLSRPPKER